VRINEMNEPSLVNESLLRQRLTDLEAARTWAPDVLAGLEHFIRTADDYDLFASILFNTPAQRQAKRRDEPVCARRQVACSRWIGCSLCAIARKSPAVFASSTRFIHAFNATSATRSQRCSADDQHPGRFHGLSNVRDNVFRHPRRCPSRTIIALQLCKGFKPPHGMTHEQLCGALQGICRY
jgi:hypothetical protein